MLALAVLFIRSSEKPLAKSESAVMIERPEPTATPFLARVPSAKWSDRKIAQGRIVGVNRDGVVLMCEDWTPPGSGFTPMMGAGAGAGDIRAAAEMEINAAAQQVKARYGDLLSFQSGTLTKPFSAPDKTVNGTILLINFPRNFQVNAGSRIRVIAVATGDIRDDRLVYSVKF